MTSLCHDLGCFNLKAHEWGDGPWDAEPDRADFRSHGFLCFVHRSGIGTWCGYVGVPRSHPAFGHFYDGIGVSVHGGLTFAGKGRAESHLCLVPHNPARWILGFDCAHAGDFMPQIEAQLHELRNTPLPGFDLPKDLPNRRRAAKPGELLHWFGSIVEEADGTKSLVEHYWTLDEAMKETIDLARQLSTLRGCHVTATQDHRQNFDRALRRFRRRWARVAPQ